MMRALGIHHMTAMELSPVEFVELVAQQGCQSVSLFSCGDPAQFPLVTPANKKVLKTAIRDTGLLVANIDPFIILANTNISDFIPKLELGVDIGAQGLSAVLLDTNEQRTIDRLGELCGLSRRLGLRVAIEFMALSPAWNTLEKAVELIRLLNCPNLGLSIDLLHLIRSGGTIADVAGVAPELIYNVQLCDSMDLGCHADYGVEAMAGRLAPGDGRFPLAELIDVLPANLMLELEVPQSGNRPAQERVRHAVACARQLIS